jgi:hypothetical protein
MTTTPLAALLSLLVACGGGAGTAYPTTPIADPIPMIETKPVPAVAAAIVTEPEPAPVEPEPAPEPTPVVVHDTHTATREPPIKPKKKPRPAAPTRVEIVVTRAGFEPKNVTVPRGKPVILRFELRVERTCGTEVVMVVDGQKIMKDLPLNQPVDVAITFGTAGVVKYSCAMDMIRGSITVQ